MSLPMLDTPRWRENPYIIGRPIYEPELFFGRRDLFEFVRDNLAQQSKVILLSGQRRIGKSSVLCHIPDVLARSRYACIPYDLQDKTRLPLAELLHNLAGEILDELELDEGTIVLPDLATLRRDPYEFADCFLPQVFAAIAPRSLVLLLDEFDVLRDYSSETAAEHFFPYLRSILPSQDRLFVIPVVGRRLDELETLLGLFKDAPHYEIGLLSDRDGGAAEQLLVKPTVGVLHYDRSAIRAILDLTSGHPYFTQLFGHALFAQARDQGDWRVTADHVEQICDRAITIGEGGLVWFRDGLPIPERVVFSAIAQAQEIAYQGHQNPPSIANLYNPNLPNVAGDWWLWDLLRDHGVERTDQLSQAKAQLVKWGYLREMGYAIGLGVKASFPEIAVEVVRRWLVRRYPLNHEIWELELLEPEAERLCDEALHLRRLGDARGSIRLYEQALALNPNHFTSLFKLAEAYRQQQNLTQAVALYERAYKVDPVSVQPSLVQTVLDLGRELILQERFEQAREKLTQASRLQPDHLEIQVLIKAMSQETSIQTVLVLAANPLQMRAIDLNEVVRVIQYGLQWPPGQRQFLVSSTWATYAHEVQRAMLDYQPTIVHFAGERILEDGLILADDQDQPHRLSPTALAELFRLFTDQVTCVVLHACYAEDQAQAIASQVAYVIGILPETQDCAIDAFMISFYDALRAGRSISDAYHFGCNAIQLSGIQETAYPLLIHT